MKARKNDLLYLFYTVEKPRYPYEPEVYVQGIYTDKELAEQLKETLLRKTAQTDEFGITRHFINNKQLWAADVVPVGINKKLNAHLGGCK